MRGSESTPPPSPRMPDSGRGRTPPPSSSSYWHASWPTTDWAVLFYRGSHSLLPPRRTVYAGFEQDQWKANLLLRPPLGTGKGPSKAPRDDPTLAPGYSFFTVAPQKGKDAAPKGGKKGKNKGKDKGDHKGKGKGKGKDQKGWPHQIASI